MDAATNAKKVGLAEAHKLLTAMPESFEYSANSGFRYIWEGAPYSHKMSRLLRHNLVTRVLSLDEKGFVEFVNLYAMSNEGAERRAITEDEVIYVIASMGASRFAVRAYQGHSGRGAKLINDEVAHQRISRSKCGTGVCVHGTTFQALS